MPPFSAATLSALPIYEQPDERERTAEVTMVPQAGSAPWEQFGLRHANGTSISGSVSDPWQPGRALVEREVYGTTIRVEGAANERLALIVRKHASGGLTTEEQARLELLTYRLDGLVPDPDTESALQRLESRVRAVDDVLAEADRLLASTR